MNITIKPGAATDTATQIDDIVRKRKEAREVVDRVIKQTIPDGIETNWSETVLANWKNYYNADIPEGMAEMQLSATNLRKAVEAAIKYGNEN